MGRLRKKQPTLESAKFLLFRRWMTRRVPRGSGRALMGLCALLLFAGSVALAADAVGKTTGRLGRFVGISTAALGFSVDKVEVEGRNVTPASDILQAVGSARGAPIMSVDPGMVRGRIEALPWVKTALVERRLPDTIHIRLDERQPLALWQHQGQIVLVDHDGVVVTNEHLDRYSNLLLIVGDNAPAHAEELIKVLNTQPEMQKRVAAAIWIGERRWNLHLNNGIDVEMPEEGVGDAWARLTKIQAEHGLLARDIQRVDMRFPDRVVVRLAPAPETPKTAIKAKSDKSHKHGTKPIKSAKTA